MNILLKRAMEQQGMLKIGARLYLSHFGMTTYNEKPDSIGDVVRNAGFLEAVDGLICN
ncbi:MAG: hypothetical protein K6F75_02725 [Butyrivibrio sp.]|nr:hypothetical protein [Butyrivibrio sp.]